MPDTQGAQTTATVATEGATNGQQQGATPPADTSSIQQRINELTAQFRQAQETAQQQAAMNQALIEQNARLTEQLTRGQQAATEQTLPPIPDDPTAPGYAQALLAHAQAPLLKKIDALQSQVQAAVGGVQQTTFSMQLQAELAGQPPAVVQAAQQLYREAQQNGTAHLYNPKNYLWMARGMQPSAPVAPTAPAGMDLQGGTPPPVVRQGPPRKSDAEIAAMPLDKRIEYYDSIVGDSEVVY